MASRQAAGDESGGALEPPTGQAKESAKQSAGPRNNLSGRKAVAPISLPQNSQRKKQPRSLPAQPSAPLPPALRTQHQERLGLLRRNSDEELQHLPAHSHRYTVA